GRDAREIADGEQRRRADAGAVSDGSDAAEPDAFAVTAAAFAASGEAETTGAERVADLVAHDVVAPDAVDRLAEELRHRRGLLLRRHEPATCIARSRERKEERVGLAVHERHANAAPIFVRVVVKERPTLERRVIADDQPVRRSPDRRLGDVAERHG